VQCCVPAETARRRARDREHHRARTHAAVRVSDATEEIVLAQGAPPAPFADVAPEAQIILRADRDPESIQADLDAVLDARMTDLGG